MLKKQDCCFVFELKRKKIQEITEYLLKQFEFLLSKSKLICKIWQLNDYNKYPFDHKS